MTITLTFEQSRCADAVNEWLKDPSRKPWFTIHGYAGSGKTSLAKHFAEQQSGRVVYAAYTGKAAGVLAKKGCTPAMTIHRMLYLPQSERNEELIELQKKLDAGVDPSTERRLFKRIEELQAPKWALSHKSPLIGASLLVLDECSMVDSMLARDILSFKIPVLVLGDPGQLPPIDGAGYFDQTCDFMLTEVHRQAAESPVIRLAMQARDGRSLALGKYGSSRVISKSKVGREEALEVAQIICGLNRTRVVLNNENRALRGFEGPYPRAGERLICLRNNQKTGMLNGTMVDLTTNAMPPLVAAEDIVDFDEGPDVPLTPEYDHDSPFIYFDTAEHGRLKAYKLCFTKPEAIKAMDYRKRAAADEVDYGWTISCHKAQGSQFESVLVYNEFTWDRDLHKRWLYTACTRAEDRVIIAL